MPMQAPGVGAPTVGVDSANAMRKATTGFGAAVAGLGPTDTSEATATRTNDDATIARLTPPTPVISPSTGSGAFIGTADVSAGG
jgi:hypothetical protein